LFPFDCSDSIDILKELSFEETKSQVTHMIETIDNKLSHILKEIEQEKPLAMSDDTGE
jgi:hypothetical protein